MLQSGIQPYEWFETLPMLGLQGCISITTHSQKAQFKQTYGFLDLRQKNSTSAGEVQKSSSGQAFR